MENALLYTFSTIAQALGGAFALLAAFVLYRFEIVRESISAAPDHIRAELSQGGRDMQWFDTAHLAGDLAALIEGVERIGPKFSTNIAVRYRALKGNMTLSVDLAEVFKTASITTGIVMLYSVAAIPFAHLVQGRTCLSWLLLTAGVVGFGASLWLYWRVISVALFR